MKTIRLFVTVSVLVLAFSCKSSTKGSWSQKERTEYMRDCIVSAKKGYQDRGLQPDSTIITTLCKCSGEMIEERYDYKEASKIGAEEVKTIMQQAVEKCLKK